MTPNNSERLVLRHLLLLWTLISMKFPFQWYIVSDLSENLPLWKMEQKSFRKPSWVSTQIFLTRETPVMYSIGFIRRLKNSYKNFQSLDNMNNMKVKIFAYIIQLISMCMRYLTCTTFAATRIMKISIEKIGRLLR